MSRAVVDLILVGIDFREQGQGESTLGFGVGGAYGEVLGQNVLNLHSGHRVVQNHLSH